MHDLKRGSTNMTNKLEISRELAERIIKGLEMGLHESAPTVKELRALLAADDLLDHCKQCADVVKEWPESKRDCLGTPPLIQTLHANGDRIAMEATIAQQARRIADLEAAPVVERQEPVAWGTPKTIRQLIQQLETLDQDLRPVSILRVPGSVFEDGKDRSRAVHLSISHERVEGQWLSAFKGDGEKVVAFWCRIEQPAPVAVVLPDLSELREYHAKAVGNLKSYADDAGLRDSDVKHYFKRAAFHAEMVALIDKVKELNQ